MVSVGRWPTGEVPRVSDLSQRTNQDPPQPRNFPQFEESCDILIAIREGGFARGRTAPLQPKPGSSGPLAGRALDIVNAYAGQTTTRSRQAGSRLSTSPTSPTTPTALGIVCPVVDRHRGRRPFRRSSCGPGSHCLIRFNSAGRPIERTGLARCAGNETHPAGAEAGTADPV